jgi:acetyl-CoA acetyltransferase
MVDGRYPEKQVAITGVGQAAVGRPSPHSAMRLTIDASLQAIHDAGLSLADIDGLVTYPGATGDPSGIGPVGSTDLMYAMGLQPAWIASSNEGHNHMGAIAAAINAVAAGMCRHVLVFRTVAQATARDRVRHVSVLGGGVTKGAIARGWQAWTLPYYAYSTGNIFALYAQAYFDKYGARSEQLGAVAVNGRRMAALNPNAIYRKPITIDDYMASRMISSPLRVFDCDTHIDGSTALIFSRRDLARDMPNPPIEIEALGLSLGGIGAGVHLGDFSTWLADKAGEVLWSHTDLRPKDVDCAQIYDGFSIHVLLWLESLGFCGRGEAAAFVEGGQRIGLDGELPLNTSGGQLSAGRFHGFGHSYEACLQLWGRAGERQVADARTCMVSNGGLGFGAMLLRRA